MSWMLGWAPPGLPLGSRTLGRSLGRGLGLFGGVLFFFGGFLFLGLLVFIRLEEVGGVQEGTFLLTDVDEGGLNARKHRLHPAEIDVAYRAAMVGAVHQQLY
jgi:hypothetical protein